MKTWSRVLCGAVVALATGCAGTGVRLAQESDHGGIVVYPYNAAQGHVLSNFRKDAVRLIEERCPAGHTIVREGETKGRSRLSGPVQAGGGELVHERRWGIQFECR